ncbi:hypothetical protein R1flu_011256 [Riccia fluitans]|uniref:Uncharacterized protein n=1 Tax=Riccia fluitans TaxID=41844 RepID=A0ABD1Z9T7_9MARC
MDGTGRWFNVARRLRDQGVLLNLVQSEAMETFQQWLRTVHLGDQKLEKSPSWRWQDVAEGRQGWIHSSRFWHRVLSANESPDDLTSKWPDRTTNLTWKFRWRTLWEKGTSLRVSLWKSLSRWRLLREKARISQASFRIPHRLLVMIDEALCAKKHEDPFTYIFDSLTTSIWKDRNATLFKIKHQETPLLISLELARAELEGSLNKKASSVRWQRGQKAMEELNRLIAFTKNGQLQLTRQQEWSWEATRETATFLSQEFPSCRDNQHKLMPLTGRRSRSVAALPRELLDRARNSTGESVPDIGNAGNHQILHCTEQPIYGMQQGETLGAGTVGMGRQPERNGA